MLELNKFKQLLGMEVSDNSKNVPLQFVLDDISETILNYCNLSELPDGLSNTGYRMAIDLYRSEAPGEEDIPLGVVSSVTTGDSSTSFKSSSSEFKDSLLKDYKKQLNRFRKVGFR